MEGQGIRMKVCFALLCFAFYPTAYALINGSPLAGEPNVVRIIFDNGWMCTGTFIDAYTILTAAHCITPENEPLHLARVLSENDETVQVDQLALLPNPTYSHQWWPSSDIGIIKTSENRKFKNSLYLENAEMKFGGGAILIGTGKTSLSSNVRQRNFGSNSFLRIGSVLFFLGRSSNSTDAGRYTTVAPNDSGGPVLDQNSRHIIGVMTTTTAKDSAKLGLPALSTATSTVTKDNLDFIQTHMGQPH
jgi:hypothetical protein